MKFDTSDPFRNDSPDVRLDLLNLAAAFRRNWPKILFFALLGGVAGYFFTSERDPIYQAQSVIVLQPENGTLNLLEISESFTATRSTVETQLDILQSTELLGLVIDTLSAEQAAAGFIPGFSRQALPAMPREELIKWLSNASSVKRKGESYAITITAKANAPKLAADLANEIGQTYIARQLDRKKAEMAVATEILTARTNVLNDDLFDKERELAKLVQSWQLDDQDLDARLSSRIAQLKTQHQNAVLANAAPETIAALNAEIEALDADYLSRTLATIRKRELLRQIQSDRLRHDQTFEQLLRNEAQAAVLNAGAHLVSAAHAPLQPIGISAKTSAALGFVATGFLALLGTFILAMFDQRVRSTKQIEDVFDSPCLATIPRVNDSGARRDKQYFYKQMLPGVSSSFTRAIRQLYFNLHIRLPKESNIVLGITSALPDEGKSTIAMSLAIAATSKRQQVAVVDFDMWHNGIDRLTDVFTAKGADDTADESAPPSLQDWFSGSKSLIEIRTTSPDVETVDIYPWTIGMTARNANLSEKNINRLFQELRKKYDLIIVDTAPFMLVSEVAELTAELDGFLVVVAWEQVTDRILTDLKRTMDLAGAEVLGCLLNRVDTKKQSQYGLGDYVQYYERSGSYS